LPSVAAFDLRKGPDPGTQHAGKYPVNRTYKKPVLRINMAQTLDGHTVQPDGKWALGSKEDKRRMDRLRLWADCIIASRRSIENDNPNLYARSKPDARHPMPVIVLNDRSRKIPATSRIFSAPHPAGELWVRALAPGEAVGVADLVDMAQVGTSAENREALSRRLEKWKAHTFTTIRDIYESLALRRYTKILLEGGPALNGLFLEADLIDEIFFTLEPCVWAGQKNDRIITSPQTLPLKKFRLLTVERRNDEVFFRYKRIRGN